MSQNVAVSSKQARAIQALLTCKSVGEAATAAGLNRRTLQRWLTEPAFRQALSEAEGELIDAATRSLLRLQAKAVAMLETLIDDPNISAGVRLRAATAAIEHMLRLRELRDVEERLQALEQRFAERGAP